MLTELTAVQRKKALALFPVERDTLIDTIGENIKGEAFGMVPENLQNDKDTAPECVFFWYRYFLYLGGSPESIYADELLEEMKQKLSDPIPLIVPNCEGWESVLRRHFPSVEVRIRAAMRIRKQGLDLKEIDRQLEQFRSPVYTLKKIDEAVFPILMKERWADGLVTNFDSCKEFIEHGFGFVLCTGEGQPVSGCSTYSYYSRGVEIQISTREEHRGQGLAKVVAAAMLKEALRRGLVPSWDAANPTSEAISSRMGYELARKYKAYRV